MMINYCLLQCYIYSFVVAPQGHPQQLPNPNIYIPVCSPAPD